MAGDWIKMRVNLLDDPAVIAIGESVGMDEYAVSGRLFKLWAWADQHTADGTIPKVSLDSIDRRVGAPGFGKAMCDVGWLLLVDGGIQFPNFDRHNGKTGKARALTAKRVAKHKSQDDDEGNADANGEVTPEALPREEKRREEKKESTNVDSPPVEPDDSPALLEFPCSWKKDEPRSWTLRQSFVDRMSERFKGVDVLTECHGAFLWVQSHKPKKANGMPNFLFSWMRRAMNGFKLDGNPHARDITPSRPRAQRDVKPSRKIVAPPSSDGGDFQGVSEAEANRLFGG